ncbi:MAG TPA: UDP-glucose/GDP-mannose dehydrogenase family protein [Phycisphaerae bacterium]|nr:UDP-glucose/GDP-mannose dehydrogenase family protein [Phycisphaerae bacterium]
MRLSVIGTGYVGLVAGTCFADGGNHVICVDIDAAKIEALRQGRIPIYEPGLSEMIQRNVKAGRLHFTTDLSQAVKDSQVVFIAVGTPGDGGGGADLTAVLDVADKIGRAMDGYRIVVTKSTVPVGTHRIVRERLGAVTTHRFDVVSNPEFMKEGAAVDDFTRPDRVVLGTDSPEACELMKQLYAPFMRKRERILVMDPASAEMAKYAANVLLATRISFMNEVANLCERLGADVEAVRVGIGADTRIGQAFLYPGVGYGGSCFPKDVKAFKHMGDTVGYPTRICAAVDETNRLQRRSFAERVIRYFEGRPATLAVWGLAFKSRTDDVRESPAIDAVRMFREHGHPIRAHDPEAMDNARSALGTEKIAYFDDCYEALDSAEALVIFTDWTQFRTPEFDLIRQKLKRPVIFDGRNLYAPEFMAKSGFEYHSIGRATVKAHSTGACGTGQ